VMLFAHHLLIVWGRAPLLGAPVSTPLPSGCSARLLTDETLVRGRSRAQSFAC